MDAATFHDPAREFGMIPFWFWNDDLDEAEIVRQIREFRAKGFGGFIPHARIGLSRHVGYLTPEYFRLVRIAVEEAARLGMKVVLYDEGSYPSGSAQGRVVAENPDFAARCLIPVQRTIEGPATGYWRPNPSRAMKDRLICVVQGRETGENALDPSSLRRLTSSDRGVTRYDVGKGRWRLFSIWNVFSGGTIRGVFDEEDSGHALAPPAGDIMKPEAVAAFLRHTHDAYYEHLKDHFGKTVVGMFTDEPSALGRDVRRGPGPKPFTDGFLDDLQERWDEDVRKWLPALWLDCGERTQAFREMYARAVQDRIEDIFYEAQNRWCAEHGIALTGHPSHSDEMSVLRKFHWPGQDMVWRWVTPGSESALQGPNSVAPKVASSAAVVRDRRFSTSEALGAYGWRLTLDEAKWVLDWHLVRGNNRHFPHACFYSIRGRRAYESEPDLGVHNVWWPHFGVIGEYVRRVSAMLTDGVEVCDAAVLTDSDHVASRAASILLQDAIDFFYLDEEALASARIEGGRLHVGRGRFRLVVFDGAPPLSEKAAARLVAFESAGGAVLREWSSETLASQVAELVGRDIHLADTRNLRALHYRKDGREIYFLVNEGEGTIVGEPSLRAVGALERWDPIDGSVRPWPARVENGRLVFPLRLERREGLFFVVDPNGRPDASIPVPSVPGKTIREITENWEAHELTSEGLVSAPCPGDWAHVRELETFSGTIRFRSKLLLTEQEAASAGYLDLGHVGDIAEVFWNGTCLGVRAWRPYVFPLGDAVRSGWNRVEVRVTNSMANALDGLQLPSGVLGPVTLRAAAPSLP